MEPRNNEAIEIDVKELFILLLHKLWIITIIGVLGAICAGSVSMFLLKPIYTSITRVYVINRQEENKMTLSDLQTGAQLTKDYMILVKSRPVTEQVIKDLNLDLTHEELSKMIRVNTPLDTRILEILVDYPNPDLAKQIADSIAAISSERMVSIMEMEKVNILEYGNYPIKPSSPNITLNTIIGGILGVILASFIVIMVYLMNDSIRTAEDIERYLGITTLGTIPLEEKDNNKRHESKQRKRKAALAS